ncbi:hypothetical protein BC940DRAFT_294460 [Gongronella butleri]|nr:hypothetical protein BC940DRAFT_294460 [Gongronella butleri]
MKAGQLLVWLCIPAALAQTISNPSFGQINATFANASAPPGSAASVLAQSLYFQTAYANDIVTSILHSDYNLKALPLFDFGQACDGNMTASGLNNGTFNSKPILQGMRKLALVQRGGCLWSQKLANVNALSLNANLSVVSILLYDNTTAPSQPTFNLTDMSGMSWSVPAYASPLPTSSNISFMQDNDLPPSGPTRLNIYYVSNDFGQWLINVLYAGLASYQSPSLPFYYAYAVILLDSSSSGSGSSVYLSWVIALGAVFLVALAALLIFFRWWRIRQRRDQREYDQMLEERNAIMLQRRKKKPLPEEVVKSFPVIPYSEQDVRNASCAICLDDYEPETKVRLLPCGHGFCEDCIDPWLLRKSTLCPVCKFNCMPEELRDSAHAAADENNAIRAQPDMIPSTSTHESCLTHSSTASVPAPAATNAPLAGAAAAAVIIVEKELPKEPVASSSSHTSTSPSPNTSVRVAKSPSRNSSRASSIHEEPRPSSTTSMPNNDPMQAPAEPDTPVPSTAASPEPKRRNSSSSSHTVENASDKQAQTAIVALDTKKHDQQTAPSDHDATHTESKAAPGSDDVPK